MGSKKFTLNWADFSKVFKTAVLVGGAAALTVVAENLEVVDIGVYTPLFVPIIAVGLDTAIKWLKDNSKDTE
tara:strand:- start:120 stop:335 length:216 start_codon:yes stop_codon:yes gene_type:complete